MNTEQYISELNKVPMLPEYKKVFNEPETYEMFVKNLNKMSDNERIIHFIFTRLSCYEDIINELGYLPSEYINSAVNACATSLRHTSQMDEYGLHSPFLFLLSIRAIGEGIASANELDKIKHDAIGIKAYSTHSFIEGLSDKATAGDCFLFNVMVCATKTTVSNVVRHYFDRFNSCANDMGPDFDADNNVSFALNKAVDDIFGKDNPLMPRVSGVTTNEGGNKLGCIILILIFLVVFALS